MKVYYLSHPYTGNEEYNVKESEVIATTLAKMYKNVLFINPLTSLKHTGYAQLPYETILEQCIKLLSFCDGLILTGNWNDSIGCLEEYKYAKDNNMKVWDGIDEFVSDKGDDI